MKKVLILGGYGHFGTMISTALAGQENLRVIIAGRSADKAQTLAARLPQMPHPPEGIALDIQNNLSTALQNIAPDIVIHTCGPFQGQDYTVAKACIAQGCHYIDLADARKFVAEIDTLHKAAKEKNVSIISGASSVPCLTAAVIDAYLPRFQNIIEVDMGISTAQRTNRGLATTAAVLGYAGQGFDTKIDGHIQTVYGWQGLVRRRYPNIGTRWLADCDVPDLALFPRHYPDIDTIRFRAGLELAPLQWMLYALAGLTKAGLIPPPSKYAEKLLRLSRWLDVFGSDTSGFHVRMTGMGFDSEPVTRTFFLLARNGDGVYIPTIPAVLLTKRLAQEDKTLPAGAKPCLGLMTLDEYMHALHGLAIDVHRP